MVKEGGGVMGGDIDTRPKVPLFGMMLCAPLIVMNPRASEPVLHAVTMEGLAHRYSDKRVTVDAACGVRRLKVLAKGDVIGLFPPRISTLPEGWTRCRECHELTGRKRPRTEWRAA